MPGETVRPPIMRLHVQKDVLQRGKQGCVDLVPKHGAG